MAYEYDGVFLLERVRADKGVDHLAVGLGSRLAGRLRFSSWQPVVVHLLPPRLQVEAWGRGWQVLARATDEDSALARLVEACQRPRYELLGNNCEHFARYVVTGKRESRQLQGAGWVAVGLAAFIFVGRRAA